MLSSRTKKNLPAALAVGVGLPLLFCTAFLSRQLLSGAPFRLIMQPTDGQTYVQFLQPDADLVSDRVAVTLELDQPYELVLDSASVRIPGGRVEFADTTLLPGAFKIRIGDTIFQVASNIVYIDGEPSGWKPTDRSN